MSQIDTRHRDFATWRRRRGRRRRNEHEKVMLARSSCKFSSFLSINPPSAMARYVTHPLCYATVQKNVPNLAWKGWRSLTVTLASNQPYIVHWYNVTQLRMVREPEHSTLMFVVWEHVPLIYKPESDLWVTLNYGKPDGRVWSSSKIVRRLIYQQWPQGLQFRLFTTWNIFRFRRLEVTFCYRYIFLATRTFESCHRLIRRARGCPCFKLSLYGCRLLIVIWPFGVVASDM